ncbi:flagellar protein FlaG [Limnohabitans sp.]|uniref:flagellar protein FlaG n=1 Tax=Limnohabitans sp. TaxID=1907725 RepID=UPI00286F9D57|nr:flagellar protein FlaG [Limnohabitans sp.]
MAKVVTPAAESPEHDQAASFCRCERMVLMLSELTSGNPAIPTPVRSKAAAPVATAVPPTPEDAPKVQAPKPVDIKVDTQALKEKLLESIQHLNQAMRDGGRNLNFHMDEAVGTPVVTVKNADTGEVVRQLPNEVVVRIAHNIEEFKGLLHNKLT